MHPLAVSRPPTAEGAPDNPHPPAPHGNPTDTHPDADALRSAYLASVRASGILMTVHTGPGTGSGPGTATERNAQVIANTGGGAENREESGDRIAGDLPGREGASAGTDVTKAEPVRSQARADGLTGKDVRNLNAILRHAMAANTKANYRGQWRRFAEWARDRGVSALPAEPAHVAAYLAERIEREGHRPATLRTAASAIAFIHKAAELADPCAALAVRRALGGATRKVGRKQKQATALTAEALALIRATADKPRQRRGGRPESWETARQRGSVDVAMISLMRDAMLRVSEAAALTWADIGAEPDGTGRLSIRRSKTDPEGEGAVVFISAPTMARLASIRAGLAGGSVFGLHRNQLAKRIKQAARSAGLGEGFSGHSPRVGMARDLARAGIELPSLMTAGRWRSPNMPALYTRNETAGKGAVAQFYGARRTPA